MGTEQQCARLWSGLSKALVGLGPRAHSRRAARTNSPRAPSGPPSVPSSRGAEVSQKAQACQSQARLLDANHGFPGGCSAELQQRARQV